METAVKYAIISLILLPVLLMIVVGVVSAIVVFFRASFS